MIVLLCIYIDISSLTPKFNHIQKYFSEKKQCDPSLVNNRSKHINYLPRNELFTSTPKLNGSVQG